MAFSGGGRQIVKAPVAGAGGNAVWRQIRAEKKKSSYIFWTIMLLSLLYIAGALVFGDMGYLKLMTLKDRSRALSAQVAELKQKDNQVKTSMKNYSHDEYYQEKLAREDLGLAKKNEYIFIFNSPNR